MLIRDDFKDLMAVTEQKVRSSEKRRKVLGIHFFDGMLDEGIEEMMQGRLALFPSGPGIAEDYVHSESYREALQCADLVFADSGAMVLLWRIFSGERLRRLSGLKVLRQLLLREEVRAQNATFWVMPDASQMMHNVEWLRKNKVEVALENCYVSPRYEEGAIEDRDLLEKISAASPRFIILAIGGGVQERLGLYLRRNLPRGISIVCIGAAIGFLTGIQAGIPQAADRLYLGWLLRCIDSPRSFVPRYLRASKIVGVVFRYWLTGRVPSLKGS